MKRIYRLCAKCHKKWNVSLLEPQEKRYICPTCALREELRKGRSGR